MRINNVTPYSTERLREIAQRVAEAELDSNQRNGITVHFTVAKSRSKDSYQARRRGYYSRQSGAPVPGLKFNQAIVTIRRRNFEHSSTLAAQYVAHDLAHEFAEMLGYTHEQLHSPRYFYRDGWLNFYEWAAELPLVLQPKPPKPDRQAIATDKLANATARLKTALTREKRAVTIRRKWERKIKYYQKQIAAGASAPAPV